MPVLTKNGLQQNSLKCPDKYLPFHKAAVARKAEQIKVEQNQGSARSLGVDCFHGSAGWLDFNTGVSLTLRQIADKGNSLCCPFIILP